MNKSFLVKRISSWLNVRFWCIFFAAVFSLFSAYPAVALNQLGNSTFDTDIASWTDAQRQAINPPAPPRGLDSNMTTWAWSAVNGGCYYVRFLSGGFNRDANSILSQNFSTPAAPINIRLQFDHWDVSPTAYDFHRLYGDIRDAGAGVPPNQTIVNSFFTDIAAAHQAGWVSNTYNVALAPSTTYIYRVLWHFGMDNAESGGAYVDNLRVDFSPDGLTATLSGASNQLAWTASMGGVALHGTNPYWIYRSNTSGVYGAALASSTTNSFTDTAPPVATITYYVISDVDTASVESPQSVELPVIRHAVRDSLGADIDAIVGSDVAMNWDNVIIAKVRYEVALGTSPGASDVVGWTDALLATNYTFIGTPLTAGSTYYTSVRIVTATQTLNSCSSDGFVSINMDVRDGAGADVNVSSSLSDVDMNWDALTIPISSYSVALGTTSGASDVVGWTNVDAAISHSFTGLTLTNGATYYCSVRAFDPSLVVIADFSSDGFAPIVSTALDVRDGSVIGSDIDYTFVPNSIGINWDDPTGLIVVRYEAALGTTVGGTDVKSWTDMGLVTNGVLSGFSLATGTTYYSSVRIVHAVGSLPSSSSDGFVYYKFNVRDGLGADIDNSFLPDTIQGNWDSSPVPFLRYDVAVGTTPGGTDIVGWTSNGVLTNASFAGLPLVNGTMYYFSVRIIDPGGIPLDTVFSDGSITTIATTINVRDGLWPDIAESFLEDRAEMNWDHPSAGIIRYEVGLGTSEFGTEVYPFTDVGHANHAALTGLSLASGTRYYATVRGINAFEAVEAFGGSDGFVARRDQVLVDTAAQSYFNNARVLRMIDTTTTPGSIQPKIFSAFGAATSYWTYRLPVAVTEPGVTSRINAPCRIQLAGLVGVVANAVRVSDESGNEISRWLLASTATTMDLVFLVNMAQSETKTYWVYWGNASAVNPGAYGFTNTATDVSANQWTPYYSRKNMPPGAEDVTLGAALSNGDDVTVVPGNLPWAFYFFGADVRAWRMNTNGFLATSVTGGAQQYTNTWNAFTGATAYFGNLITPMWADFWPGGVPPAPQDSGIYRNVFADRVVYTWRANRWNVRDDIYITQSTLYKSSDIALKYSYLSTLGVIGPIDFSKYDRPVNIQNTVGISKANNTMWLRNTPLIVGIGKSPTAFYQCADAFRGFYTAGPPVGGAGWAEIAHIESMVFDSRTANPIWQRIEYDCSGNANNRLTISTRSGSTPLPDGSWTGWVTAATVTANGNTALTNTDRYIQYRAVFERNAAAGA
ncbi:MAG: hypothetical protein KKB51_06020, partial [Candidatus Riflebacteria bacterium]|nr:hypothetical protein [Candidatus Riflebacteria bacterium]